MKHPPSQTAAPRVLLIEDDPVFQSIIERVGALAGISIQSFASANAIDISQLEQFDVAICDYETDGLTGLQTSILLRRYAPSLPVLIISAYRKVRGMKNDDPANSFLHKSAGPQRILSVALELQGQRGKKGN